MDEPFDTKRLVVLRKLTRAVADHVRGQLKDHLTTLAPLLRPRNVLGEFVKSDVKESVRGADIAFKEMQTLYAKLAGRPFNFVPELRSPVDVTSSVLEFIPIDYVYAAKTEREAKTITVISPMKWLLSYSGFNPKRMRELLAQPNRTTNDLEVAVHHALMLHIVLTRQPALVKLLEALHFTIATGPIQGLGDVPIVTISSIIPTIRPPDELIIESTEMSGTNSFEEVVSLSDLAVLRDPFREKLIELAKAHGEDLAAK